MKTRALLCVDDDLGVLEFYETLLASEGYEVLPARDARQALALFDARKDEISAVMSDYSMPEINGLELAAELKRRDPRGASDPDIRLSASLAGESSGGCVSTERGPARDHFESD